MVPSEINQDPVQGEFFTSASDLPERLVRESIQNSLDARRGDETVEVRFAFGRGRRALAEGTAKPYLEGLQRHLVAIADAQMPGGGAGDEEEEVQALFRAWALLDKPLEYLVVEDFGTAGLMGDPEANTELETGNDFWGFFRSVGISPKSEDAAGSWGLGRWVFPDASHLNTYLGLTQAEDKDYKLLMGLAMLKTHHIDDTKYPPYGFFAAHSDELDHEWLPRAVTSADSPAFIEQCQRDFDLRRGDEPGLSIIVPHPHEDLTPRAIERAVISQYFLPIVRGDLRVRIGDAESDEDTVLDRFTLEDGIERVSELAAGETARQVRDDETPEALRAAIRLAKWASDREGAGDQQAYTEIYLPAAKYAEAIDEMVVEGLRDRFEANERLAFRLTMHVTKRGESGPKEASFRVYLERAERLARGHCYYVRGHLRIPMAAVSTGRFRQARALVVADGDTALGYLLRDSEGPAHASWDPHAQRLKERWSGGFSRVQAVRAAPRLLLRRLAQRSEERQLDALADLFPADPGRVRRRGPGPNPPRPPKPSVRDRIRVNGLAGGFSLSSIAGNPPAKGSAWTLRMAYDVARGDAFSWFDKGVREGHPDFSLVPMMIDERGCSYKIEAENALSFLVEHPGEFRLRVAGFDHRDVIVDVREVENSDADEADPSEANR